MQGVAQVKTKNSASATPCWMYNRVTAWVSRVALHLFDIFDFENTATLKSGSGVTQGRRNDTIR